MTELMTFRPLTRADFPLLQVWLAEPHVESWWHEPLDPAGLERTYGPRIDGTEPTHVFVMELRGRPFGWIQWYRWSDYPEHAAKLGASTRSAGIDLAIGEKSLLGQGLGPQAIREFVRQFVFVASDIEAVFADPETENARSVQAFEKAGFGVIGTVRLEGESFLRRVMQLQRHLPPADVFPG